MILIESLTTTCLDDYPLKWMNKYSGVIFFCEPLYVVLYISLLTCTLLALNSLVLKSFLDSWSSVTVFKSFTGISKGTISYVTKVSAARVSYWW